MYGSRAVLIALYLAPEDRADLLSFRCGLGATWLATVPPTAANRRASSSACASSPRCSA
jgi:hypothetical protein